MKNTIEVRLLGQRIALKSAGSSEIIREVVDIVNKKIENAEKRCRDQVPHYVALLALMDMAEEYVQARKKAADHIAVLDKKTAQLLDLLEAEKKQ